MFSQSCSRVKLTILTLALTIFSGSVWAADVAAGKAAYAVCSACHGADGLGNRAMNAPKLAGQEPWYLKRQLEAFKAGHRGTAPGDTYGAQMRPMAMVVTDAAAADNLAAYIESLPAPKPEATVSGDAAKGKAGFAVCAACHGANGEGNEAMGGPRLAGQNDWYLARQIQNYQNNLRGYDPKDTYGRQMKPMSMTLTTEQSLNDVLAHINTLD
ncbi:MAG: cytochrome c [Pseudomonadales bacterium]